MNFTLFSNEVLGSFAPLDPLPPFLHGMFIKNNLVDTCPLKLIPTWKNNRERDTGEVKEESFHNMVREVWPTFEIEERLNAMDNIVKKLQKLKKQVKVWIKIKEEEDKQDLIQTEGCIK